MALSPFTSLVGTASPDFFIVFSLLSRAVPRHSHCLRLRYCRFSSSSFLLLRSHVSSSFRLPRHRFPTLVSSSVNYAVHFVTVIVPKSATA